MKNKIFSLLAFALLIFSACEKGYQLKEDEHLVPLTVVEDATLPSITIDGIQLHSETFGNPTHTMLLVLHGGPGADYRSILNFQQLAADSMFVVFYDQRGSGLSERVGESSFSDVQVFIDELDGVINHYRHNSSQKIILAGHSWGAMLATAYVNQNPDKITGLILAEPGGLTWEQTESYLEKSRQIKLFDETTNDFVFQDQFISGSDHNTLDYKMALSIAGDVSTGDIAPPTFWRYGWVCNSASIKLAIDHPEQLNFTTQLSNYSPKVLFAYSELNEAYGEAHATLVSSAFVNVEQVEILGCGHEIPQYGWSNFYPIIKNYLNEIL